MLDKFKKKKTLKPKEPLLVKGSPEEKKQLARLRQEITKTQIDFVKFSADGSSWLANYDKKYANKQVELKNNIYQQRMMLMAAAPLTRGLSPEALSESFGMFMGLVLTNPEFKNNMKKNIGNALGWESMVKKGNDGRLPFTAESAACIHLSMITDAYTQMRMGNADIPTIRRQYQQAQETLYSLAEKDGLSIQEIHESERIIVGKFVQEDPGLADMYAELGFEAVEKADGVVREVVFYDEQGNPTEKTQLVWTGEYQKKRWDEQGNVLYEPYTKGFSVREPEQTLYAYECELKSAMKLHLDVFEPSLMSIVEAREAIDYAQECYKSLDDGIIPPEPPKWISESMVHQGAVRQYTRYMRMAKMDGFSDEEIDSVVHDCFVHVGSKYCDKHPNIAKEYAEQYYADGPTYDNNYAQRAEDAFGSICDGHNDSQNYLDDVSRD